MDKENSIIYIAEKLKSFGANVYDYQGTKFIGIKNPYSDNNIAITFGEDLAMEFTYQTAHFSYGDEDELIAHTAKYIKGELVAVEFFTGGKALFGGSRQTPKNRLKTATDVATFYAVENKEIADNLLKFFSQNDVVVKIFSFNGKADLELQIKA